jgi:hypothetical protein
MVAVAAAALVILAALPIFAPRERVTRANFARIETGMTEAELRRLLGGRPDYCAEEMGRVVDAGNFVINGGPSAASREGYRVYRRLQWSSPETTICVVLDATGRVACRYSGSGQTLDRHRSWAARFDYVVRSCLPFLDRE